MVADYRSRLETFVLDENKTAIVFYLAGAAAGIALLPDRQVSGHEFTVILSLVICLLIGTALRIIFRSRITPLVSQIMFVVGWSLVTVAAAIGPSLHINLAVLYIWVTVYAALYFKPVLIILQTGAAEVAYFLVLVNSDIGMREVILSWVSIFGTAMVLAVVVFALVSTLKRNGREDRLTGLPNRRSWDERVDAELERARRSGAPLSIVSMDIDDFKQINDREGHAGGDRLIRAVAKGWHSEIREGGDFVARLGGDEFGLLAPGSDAETMATVLQRLQDSLPDGVACSMGVATWDHVETSADFFRRADEAMFQTKRERKMLT